MDEQIIKTKRGLYGRVNVTLPLPVKTSILEIQKKSGIKKAEFLRVALILGSAQLGEKVITDFENQDGRVALQQPART